MQKCTPRRSQNRNGAIAGKYAFGLKLSTIELNIDRLSTIELSIDTGGRNRAHARQSHSAGDAKMSNPLTIPSTSTPKRRAGDTARPFWLQLLWVLIASLIVAGLRGDLVPPRITAPRIDRDALRGAGTTGTIVMAERFGEGSVLTTVNASSADARDVRTEKRAWLYQPTASSDGQGLAVARIEEQGYAVEIGAASGRTRKRYTVPAWPWLAWRPERAQLAVASAHHNGEDGIHLLDLETGRWQRLVAGAQEVWPAWSPQGDVLAYSRLEPQRSIYLFDLNTKRERRFCEGVLAAFDPRGGRLAIIRGDREAIELVDLSTAQRAILAKGGAYGRLAWSPDGRFLLADDTQARTYILIDVQSGAVTTIGRVDGTPHGFCWGR